MTKTIQTTVDAEGNVRLDLVGFVGQECVAEERRIRRGLAGLGLGAEATIGHHLSVAVLAQDPCRFGRAIANRASPGSRCISPEISARCSTTGTFSPRTARKENSS